MLRRRPRWIISLIVMVLFVAACSLSPLRLLTSDRPTPEPPIVLARCGAVQDVMCLATFGLEPPDQMLIVLLVSPGFEHDLKAAVIYKDATLPYECTANETSPDVVQCTGAAVPLGSRLAVDVSSVEPDRLLAHGEFILTALAMPTVTTGGLALPLSSALPTDRFTRTPGPADGSQTPGAGPTSPVARTPAPGTAYPNPTP